MIKWLVWKRSNDCFLWKGEGQTDRQTVISRYLCPAVRQPGQIQCLSYLLFSPVQHTMWIKCKCSFWGQAGYQYLTTRIYVSVNSYSFPYCLAKVFQTCLVEHGDEDHHNVVDNIWALLILQGARPSRLLMSEKINTIYLISILFPHSDLKAHEQEGRRITSQLWTQYMYAALILALAYFFWHGYMD